MHSNKLNLVISSKKGTNLVDARNLHEFLNSKQNFPDWIKNRIKEYSFVENEDYTVYHKNMINSKGGRPAKEYSLTLDMAKELAMVERSELGRQARRYFIESEKKLQTKIVKQLPSPTNNLKKLFKKHNVAKIRQEYRNLIAHYFKQEINDFKHSKEILTIYDETNNFFSFVESLD